MPLDIILLVALNAWYKGFKLAKHAEYCRNVVPLSARGFMDVSVVVEDM